MRSSFMRAFLILAAVLTVPLAARAATYTVGPGFYDGTCSAANVNAAIAAASDGDTVLLTCTGTVSWTQKVTIPDTKGITLMVRGGTNTPKGSASFPLTVTGNQDPILSVNCENNRSLTRVSGFKFTNTIASNYGAILVKGRGKGKTGLGAFRIDNNYFTDIQLPHADLYGTVTVNSSTGVMTGLIDNNTFHDCSYTDGYTIAIIEQWKYGGSTWDFAGMNAWTRPLGWGTGDFVFIEDNLIENVNHYTRHLIMGIEGAKYVARYNTFDTNMDNNGVMSEQIDAHGFCFCSNIGAGTRGGEIYHNTFKGSKIGMNMNLRGGSWLVYDNTFTNFAGMVLKEYRAGSQTYYGQCTPTCASESPWYVSNTDNPSRYPLAEQITDSYFWNNLYNGSNQSPQVVNDGYQPFYIQQNRDYFVSASKPTDLSGYTPYPYPHPLITGGTVQPVTHTVISSAGGNGSISPSGAQSVDDGATVVYTVTPNAGYTASVGGTCGGTLAGTTYTTKAVTADCTVTAAFSAVAVTYTVTPSAGPNGSISPATPTTVADGSTTQFTVTPVSGYSAIVGGTCGGTLAGTTYTTNAITADCTVVANFSQSTLTHTVTLSESGDGQIDPMSPMTVGDGATAQITVTPDTGYRASVSGTCGGSLSGTTYTTKPITADCTVAVAFTLAPTTFTVTPSAGPNGSITPSTPGTVTNGSVVQYVVTPLIGYVASVGGTCGGELRDTTYTTNPIMKDCTVVATFQVIPGSTTRRPSPPGNLEVR